jgi:hypothetical protein
MHSIYKPRKQLRIAVRQQFILLIVRVLYFPWVSHIDEPPRVRTQLVDIPRTHYVGLAQVHREDMVNRIQPTSTISFKSKTRLRPCSPGRKELIDTRDDPLLRWLSFRGRFSHTHPRE